MSKENCILRVALTGNIGSGKSTVARLLEKYGVSVLDADRVVHRLLERDEVKEALVRKLGREVLNPDGSVNRRAVAERVFGNPELLRWLESLLHPKVYEEFDRFCGERGGVCALEAALVFEKGNQNRFHYTVLVYAPKEVAKKRALQRGLSEEEFERRWSRQMDPEKKKKLADFVVDNSGPLEETERQVRELARFLKEQLGRFC
ncbi:MAG: dephospho-CoA kinase [Aquificae bacterium]|nr:dephospho-CoA kinase [Aquificota bacterium]